MRAMRVKAVAVVLALGVWAAPAFARQAHHFHHSAKASYRTGKTLNSPVGCEALQANIADLAVNSAFSHSARPKDRQLLAVLLLMSSAKP